MLYKEEKGLAVTDIAISIILITIFLSMIGSLIFNINLNSQDTKRKTIATSYAVQEIEKIKSEQFEKYMDKGITEPYEIDEDILEDGIFSGYHKKIIVRDYVLIKEDETKKENLVKEIVVEISYKLANKEKNISISTLKTNY